MPILVTNAVQIARFANALYGIKLGSTTNTSVMADVSAVGLAAAVNSYYTSSFGSTTNASVATTILGNVGLAGNAGAQAYVEAQLNAAGAAKGAAVLSILNAFSNLDSDATFGAAARSWNTKIDAARAYTLAYTSDVTTDTQIAVTGQTFVLTTSLDNRTGGAADDMFDASLSSTSMTLNNFDILNGGEGSDSLAAVINAASTFSPTLTSIEKVSTQFTAAGTLSLANATGVTSVENTNSSAASIFSNISSTAIALKNTGTGSNVGYSFTTAAVAGTADTANLTLSNTTGGVVSITGVETVNIISADAPNTIDASGIAATTLNISGTQNTALGTVNAAVATLNAGSATGTLSATMGAVAAATVTGSTGADTIVVSAVTGTVNVSTGTGNDSITANTNLLASDTINGGADGTDTLITTIGSVDTTATATAFTNISNMERLGISNALANTLTTSRVQAGLTTVLLTGGGTGTVNLEAGAKTVSLGAALTGGLTVNDTGVATNDALTLNSSSTTSLNLGAGNALTIGGFETTTISSTVTGAAVGQTYGAIGITPDTGGAVTLNLTGSNNITIGAVTAASATSLTIDASGLTGTAAATIAAPVRTGITTGATSIVGSANADTITGSNNNTTIDGGAGNDGITASTAVDSIAGGLGDDTFTFAANLTASDTINGGAGNDTVSITTTSNDVDWTNTSTVEVLAVVGAFTSTLGSAASTAGFGRAQLGAVGTVENITVGSGFANDLTVVMAATGTPDADVVSAAAYTKNLTVQTANVNGLTGTYTGGTGSADRIVFDLTSNAITQANIAGITAIESIVTTGSGANGLSVTLNDANIALSGTLTIDGSALTSGGALTVVGTAETDGKLVVIGGSSADAITGTASTNGDNLTGGSGNDTFTMAGNLASTDTISGGDGTDTVTVSGTVADAAFTNVSSVESVTTTGALTLGALAKTAGVTAVNTTLTTTAGSGFSSPLTVTLATATTASVVATAFTNALTVNTSDTATSITATDTITGGTGTTDRINFNATTAAVVETAADLAAVTAIETFAITGSTVRNATFTLADVNVAATKSLTIDGSNLTTGVLTVVATNETNGSVIAIGGNAADSFTGSASILGDNFSGGTGNDTFIFATANLTSADTVAGGTGTDILQISNASTVVDASFTNITSVETLNQGTGGANQTITLGALANSSGLATIQGNGAGVDVVTVGATFTNALRVDMATGDDNIDASATTGALNARAAAAALTAADTVKGGTGTGDVLTLTADNDGTGAVTTLITGFETINVVASTTVTEDIVITMGANSTQIAAGKILTVNATALTDTGATLTFVGTASETDGSLSVTGGNGADTITGGAFNDTLVGGAGADRFTGGLSADTLTGGTGADTFVYTSASVAASSGAAFDSITDWTSATDKLEVTLNYSTTLTAITVDASLTGTGVAGVSAAQDTLSGARGQYVYDTTNSVLLINVNNDNLITTSDFRIGLNAASTAANTVADGDINFVITGTTLADVIAAGGGADTIDGGTGNDSITAGAGADSITAGTGLDTILGGSGADTIILGGGAEADVVGYSQAAGADGGTTAATADTITGFVAADDTIAISGALKTAIDLTGANAITQSRTSTGGAGNVATGATTELLFSVTANSALTTANFGDMAAVATALNAMFDFTTGPTGPVLALIAGSSATAHALYLYTETGTYGDNSASSAELRLLGVFTSDAALAATAITIA